MAVISRRVFPLLVVLNFALVSLTNSFASSAATKSPQETGVRILSPESGTVWQAGSKQRISWRSDAAIEFVSIEYSIDGGKTWQTIRNHTSGNGSYEWTVPKDATNRALIRCRAIGQNDQGSQSFSIIKTTDLSQIEKAGSGAPGSVHSAASATRIMPLGDSITEGQTGSTDDAGYRNDLAGFLDGASIAYDLVGTLSLGSGFDNDHEGHSGYWADELLAELDTYLNANPPDIVLLHIGTNDISSLQTPQSTRDEISAILDTIHNFDDTIDVILSSVIPRTDSQNDENDTLNGLLADLFVEKQNLGYRIYFADNHAAFVANANWQSDYMADSVHPNDAGYAVMADVWFDVIVTVLDNNEEIHLTLPNGCEKLLAGSSQPITWYSVGLVNGVQIEISSDGGASWSTIADNTPDDGLYDWTVPMLSSDNCLIRLTDAGAGQAADSSAAVFSIDENDTGRYALRFDGYDDYVEIPDSPELSGGSGKSITVEAWVFLKSVQNQKPIVSKLKDAKWKDWGMVVQDGELQVAIETNGDDWETAAGSISADTWTHLAFTFDNDADVVRLYVNGQQVGSDATLTKDMPDTDVPVLIGKNFYVDFFSDGFIDEVRIWDHARSQSELQDNMNLILSGSEPGLIAYWQFSNGSGQTLSDNSVNGHDGTLGVSTSLETDDPMWVLSDAPVTNGQLDSISDLVAVKTAQAINLQWSAITGASEYQVYRATDAYFDTTGQTPIAVVTTTEFTNTDDDANNNVLGDPDNNYFYGVVAANTTTRSALSNRVGEFDYELGAGFNFVALPLSETSITNAQDFGEAIDAEVGGGGASAIYQMAAGSWQLMAFKVNGSWILSNSDDLVVGEAYLVNMSASGTWTTIGNLSLDVINSLNPGFNALMLPFEKAASEVLENAVDLGESIDAASSGGGATAIYQMQTGSWQLMAFKQSGVWIQTSSDAITPGHSYLINMSGSGDW